MTGVAQTVRPGACLSHLFYRDWGKSEYAGTLHLHGMWLAHAVRIPLSQAPKSRRDPCGVDIRIQIASGVSPLRKMANKSTLAIFEHDVEQSLIGIRNVADYEIRGGRRILVWPAAGAANKDVELFLFGPVWSTLCHQRGLLPLHASAVVTSGGITAFAGHSGAGKSTIAAFMCSLGYELVTDDVLPISFGLRLGARCVAVLAAFKVAERLD